MRVIAKSTLRVFWIKHKDSEEQLKAWFNEAEKYLLDILTKFPMTDFLWLTLGDIYSKEKLFNKALNCYQKTRQIKKQKGASDSDKDLIFIEQKINDTKKNAL